MCKTCWASRDDFLNDDAVELAGYQANFKNLDEGYFLFNHMAKGCGTTIAIEVASMMDLYDGPVYETSKLGSDQCSGYCLTVDNFQRCEQPCRNARVREVMAVIVSGNAR